WTASSPPSSLIATMWKIAVWLVALSVVLGGCGPSTKTAATTLPLTGNLTVTYSFAGSQALVTQIQQGAPADVFASADQKSMQKLVDAGLVDAPRVFARNKLEIVVAPGNPKHITGLADLAQPGLVVVLEDPSVPAGAYSRQALQKAGVTVK